MKTEFEVKILDIDVLDIKERLRKAGAKKVIDRNMRRYVYDVGPGRGHIWMRLRDNGKTVTLAVKEIVSNSIDGTKEAEVEVNDFDSTKAILDKLNFKPRAYQENKRESYQLDDVEIEIDSWPKIPPYLEVEAKSAEDIRRVVELLGFNMSDTTTKTTIEVYKKHGINLMGIKDLRF